MAEYSRAALRLPDDTVLRVAENTTLRWAWTQDEPRSVWEILQGIIHIISRDPRSLEFSTPFANAGLEGTEFLIRVTETLTEISVIEGRVSMESAAENLGLDAGEIGIARSGTSFRTDRIVNLRDPMSWALFFAPILGAEMPEPGQDPPPGREPDATFLAGRAVQRLRLGQIEEARADLADALALDPAEPLALGVDALISGRFGSDPGRPPAVREGGAIGPEEIPTLIVRALMQSRLPEIQGLRQQLERAVDEVPGDALLRARLAEARLAAGQVSSAVEAARQARDIDPAVSLAHSILGFAHLASLELSEAAAAFETAIELDEADPLPHLGLGLTRIRQGERTAGRRELEVSVVLNPDDALLRSYVAKVYYDERRGDLAEAQLELAKELDAGQPTPWLYETFVRHSENRPVDALRSIDRAMALNADEAIFRSRLRLDEDLAVRSAALGKLYADLGFERLAVLAGARSIGRNAYDYSGHRLLADTYWTLPRHQIARVNELFKSQLLQPENVTGIPPQLAEPNMFILDTAGPADVAYTEYNPLIAGNHWTVQGAGVVGSQGSQGENVTVSGIHDKVSYSVGQFAFATDGFRENNDLDFEVKNAFVQVRPGPATSILGELRSTSTEKGDLKLLFDPDRFLDDLRQTDGVDSMRLGLHHEVGQRLGLLAALQYQEGASTVNLGPDFSIEGELDGYALDFQSLYAFGRAELVSGINLMRKDLDETSRMRASLPFPPFEIDEVRSDFTQTKFHSAYAYGNLGLTDALRVTLGGSVDRLIGQEPTVQRFNPKLGVSWEPSPGVVLRSALFRTLQGPLVSKDNIQPRLEPTQVAGFNQFFFGSQGDLATRFGIAFDRRLSSTLYYGIELSRRNIETEIVVVDPSSSLSTMPVETDETSGRLYAYWAPRSSVALRAELWDQSFDNNGHVLGDGYARLDTRRLPLGVSYFHRSGFSAGFTVTYVDQSGRFGREVLGPGGLRNEVTAGEDAFSVLDASFEYRLPGRRGMLGLYIRNVADEKFRFQDTDPENPRIMPERFVSLRFALAM